MNQNISNYLKNAGLKRFIYKGKYTKKAVKFMEDEFILGNTDLIIDKTKAFNPLTLKFEKKAGRKSRKGFIKLPEIKSFYNPVETTDGAELKNFLKSKNASGLNRLIIKVDGKIRRDTNINISTTINDWWKNNADTFLVGPTGEQNWIWSFGAYSFILSPYTQLEKRYYKQAFRDNKEGLCFFEPILDYFNNVEATKSSQKKINTILNKLNGKKGYIKKYKNGVNEEQMTEICKDLNIGVFIHSPLSNNTLFECKPSYNTIKNFRFINTRLNHIEENLIGKYDNIFYNDNVKEVTREELNELYNNKEYNICKKDKLGVSTLYTQKQTYTYYNEHKKTLQEFKNKFNDVKFNIYDNEYLREFINASLHYPSCFDCINTENLKDTHLIKHIDQKKAYSLSKKSQFYSGFLGDIQQFIKIENNDYSREGFYYITDLDFTFSILNEYNKKFKLYVNNQIYPRPDLKMLNFYNVKFKVKYGLIGSSFDFDWSKEMLDNEYKYDEKLKVPLYSKFIGSLTLDDNCDKLYFKGDKKHLKTLVENDINIFYPDDGDEAYIEHKLKKYYSYKHITSYVLSYQRTQMIQQLLEIPLKNIIRVVVDGIYYYDYNNVKLLYGFRPKKQYTFKNKPDDELYTTSPEIIIPEEIGEYREYNRLTLLKGEGGNGKTHKCINDKGLLNVLFVSPSWLLSSDKRKEYTNRKFEITTHYHLLNDPHRKELKNKYSNIIIDEVSMLNYEQIEKIKNYFSRETIYFCGDIGYQLPPIVKGREIQDNQFDKVIKLTENFRFQDNIIIDLTKWCRNKIENNESFNLDTFYQKIQSHKIISIQDLKQIYNTNQIILCSQNNICDEYTNEFKDLKKYMIKKNYPNKNLYNGEIIYDIKEKIKYELRHGFTIHIIQGKTAKDNIYIDLRHIKGWRMLYTAISRAKTINQLYFINP